VKARLEIGLGMVLGQCDAASSFAETVAQTLFGIPEGQMVLVKRPVSSSQESDG
jgi:hypothetical protein